MTFEEWWATPVKRGDGKVIAEQAWDTATEEVKKDHFKIGEEVELYSCVLGIWEKGKVVGDNDNLYCEKAEHVRRIPEWELKEGEAVMFPWYNDNNVRTWYAGTYKAGIIYFADDSSEAAVKYCKPFDPDKIGKPWDEV